MYHNWDTCLDRCAKEDLYYPHPALQDMLWWGLSCLEPLLQGSRLRKKALEETMRLVHYEVTPCISTEQIPLGTQPPIILCLAVA